MTTAVKIDWGRIQADERLGDVMPGEYFRFERGKHLYQMLGRKSRIFGSDYVDCATGQVYSVASCCKKGHSPVVLVKKLRITVEE